MDESDREISESDLSYYEEEVEVNAYGSPIRPIRTVNRAQCPRETTVNGTVAAPSTSDANSNRMVCNFKNTCSRKKSARYEGCPCQNANLKCSKNCKCGTKKAPCKNQVEEGQEIGNPSAFARHRQAVEDSQREIKEFVTKLTSNDKDQLLVSLLSQQKTNYTVHLKRTFLCETVSERQLRNSRKYSRGNRTLKKGPVSLIL
ncbi:hypothetical protein AWC38_SpisGene21306 [Stylophora pistillata]|uniref:Uncharacterized protein n=1 Tax=Stylophora pistillata TaxID=50429 RepID=A0A2B4RDU3_STYPI|nr:hypothetical protein AWC38_SpisGene21306 [Stylophora pistillata]